MGTPPRAGAIASWRATLGRRHRPAGCRGEGPLLFLQPGSASPASLFTARPPLCAAIAGLMFWANKAAFASIFILIALWAAFRFLGPALGLYTLADDF